MDLIKINEKTNLQNEMKKTSKTKFHLSQFYFIFHSAKEFMNKNIKFKNCKLQKPWKVFSHPNFIIHQSKEKTKKEHDILTKN